MCCWKRSNIWLFWLLYHRFANRLWGPDAAYNVRYVCLKWREVIFYVYWGVKTFGTKVWSKLFSITKNFNIAEAREITKAEHLNGKNYQTWKYNIKLVLMERGLYGFINGTEEQPAKTATAQVKSVHHLLRLRSEKAYIHWLLSVLRRI